MTEMSFPSLGELEFGGIDHLVPPGQDPQLLRGLLAAFTADLEPKTFIQRLWVRDMAIETARIEYLRLACCAVERLIDAKQVPAEKDEAPGDGEGAARASNTGMAKVYFEHFALFNDIMRLELDVQRERDELIKRYDNRGDLVKMLEDAVKRLEELEGRDGG
jgi:hypothetical protein